MRMLNQQFAAPGGTALGYDLVLPEGAGPFPLVVCLHGGGWISGDKSDMHEIALWLASEGFGAACPSYRLAPLYPFPAAVEDVMAVVRFAIAQASELGVDPTRFASFGNSAGGHLAAMLGVLSRMPTDSPDAVSARVKAVVDICGISDVTDPRAKHLPISWSFLEQFMEVPFEGNEERFKLASPLQHVDANAAEFLLIHGEDDDVVPISQSEEMHASLEANGVKSRFIRLPGEGHALSYQAWPGVAKEVLAFLKETLA